MEICVICGYAFSPMPNQPNIHGRKWGRGLRPWLLIPKYLCVSALLGGLLATLALLPGMPEPGDHPSWLLIKRIYHWTIVPGTAGAILFGVLLLLQHPREFLRMRWILTKLTLVVLCVPAAHLTLSHELNASHIAWQSIFATTLLFLLAFLLIAILGRLKPRLGQKYSPPPAR